MAETIYLTKQGLAKIKKEYSELLEERKAKMSEESPNVLHSEDVNPEYVAFQEDIERLEAKISELEGVLERARVLRCPPKHRRDVADVGAVVFVEVNGKTMEYRLVNGLEADPSTGFISIESPVGRALMGKKIGEEAAVQFSARGKRYKIKKVKYLVG
jgi:transcription elongation factor GreA